MPEKHIKYSIELTDEDRMKVRQFRNGYDILEFSVQLELLIGGHWRKAVRFDSAHGRPHRHVYYPDGLKYVDYPLSQNNNAAFTESQEMIKRSFQRVRERYMWILERME